MSTHRCSAFKCGVTFLAVTGLAVLASSVTSVANAQVSFVDIFHNAAYTQTGNGNSTSLFGYFADARLFSQNPGDFTSVTLTYPGPGSPAALSANSPTEFGLASALYPTQAAMDADFPMGAYTFDANGPAGPATVTANYNADSYTTSIPFLDGTNYSDLQGMYAANPFSFIFSPFSTVSGADFSYIFLTIFDNTTNTFVYDAGFLPPTTTGVVLPGNTLAAGHDYTYELNFSTRVLTSGSGGIFPPQLGFDVRTAGSFSTAAVPEPSAIAFLATLSSSTVLLLRRRHRTA